MRYIMQVQDVLLLCVPMYGVDEIEFKFPQKFTRVKGKKIKRA